MDRVEPAVIIVGGEGLGAVRRRKYASGVAEAELFHFLYGTLRIILASSLFRPRRVAFG
jgi:hypothetical protein